MKDQKPMLSGQTIVKSVSIKKRLPIKEKKQTPKKNSIIINATLTPTF